MKKKDKQIDDLTKSNIIEKRLAKSAREQQKILSKNIEEMD